MLDNRVKYPPEIPESCSSAVGDCTRLASRFSTAQQPPCTGLEKETVKRSRRSRRQTHVSPDSCRHTTSFGARWSDTTSHFFSGNFGVRVEEDFKFDFSFLPSTSTTRLGQQSKGICAKRLQCPSCRINFQDGKPTEPVPAMPGSVSFVFHCFRGRVWISCMDCKFSRQQRSLAGLSLSLQKLHNV